MSELTTLPNIGKETANKLKKININTAEDFLSRDPYQVFNELLEKVDPTLCRSFLAGLVGAYKNTKWNLVSKESATNFLKKYPKHKW